MRCVKGMSRMLGRTVIPRFAAVVVVSVLALTAASPRTGAAPAQTLAVTEPAAAATQKRLRRMSSEQYLNTLNYIFGADLRIEPRFAPRPRRDGLLESGAAVAGVTDSQLEQYQRTASLVASRVVSRERRDFLIPCKPASDSQADRACAEKFLSETGRYLFRRPMTKAEVKAVVDNAGAAADKLKNFYTGLSVALEGMLLQPEALFFAEKSEPDPKHPGQRRLTAYALASRLSFFLWNAAPDDELLKAAETGEILTEKGRARVVDMMLASPRLEAGMRAFFDDMFHFDDFATLTKDAEVYPAFTGLMVGDAREQSLRTVIDHLITKKQDYRDLYTTRHTYISPSLAAMYGVPSQRDWAPHAFPQESLRLGLLTQISFLAVHAHPARSSPTLRGKALREIFLCQTVPPPPANVDFSAVDNPDPSLRTARERLDLHQRNPVCAGCHRITDPMGLALENFDGAGKYRATEKGAVIDTHGSLDGRAFTDATGLAQALHDHPALPACLVKRVYAYGTGGATTPKEQPMLEYLNARFASEGYRLPDLLRAIVLSKAFATVVEPPPVEETPAGRSASADPLPEPVRSVASVLK